MNAAARGSSRPTLHELTVHGDPTDQAIADAIKKLVEAAKTIVISGHERPDGDCIGSEVALCSTLRANGFNASIVNADPTPDRYAYLDPEKLIRQAKPGEQIDADLVIVVDATDLRRLGKLKPEQFGNAKLIDIDHHLSNPHFGVVNLVDTKASASGELIWRIVSHCGWKVPLLAMNAMYTAIITDTGQFAYANTTPRVLRMAAELIERGVDPEALWHKIYLNRSHNEMELETRARASLKCFAGGKIARISLTHQDFQDTKTGPQHTEELASIPRSLEGVELALFMYEVNDGQHTKVSIRTTRGLDACALAQKFGGGGHRQAAGCTIPSKLPEAIQKLMPEAEKLFA